MFLRLLIRIRFQSHRLFLTPEVLNLIIVPLFMYIHTHIYTFLQSIFESFNCFNTDVNHTSLLLWFLLVLIFICNSYRPSSWLQLLLLSLLFAELVEVFCLLVFTLPCIYSAFSITHWVFHKFCFLMWCIAFLEVYGLV